jgi:hypothetical protein
MPLLLENIIEDTNDNANVTCQTQLQKLIQYKGNNNDKHTFIERLNDTVGRMYICSILDVTTNGRADETLNMLYGHD